MIKKPAGYDEAQAYTGESIQLPKGKYICSIVQVATQTSTNGKEQFVILFDIAEGEYKDFYKKMFETAKAQNGNNAKWKGVFKQNMDGKGTSWLKGIVTSIERSNNFTFQWDKEGNEKTLAGKKFGGIFRREQFRTDDGITLFATKLWRIRSVAGLDEAEIPEDELLPGGAQGSARTSAADATPPSFNNSDGFVSIPEGAGDEGIPFM